MSTHPLPTRRKLIDWAILCTILGISTPAERQGAKYDIHIHGSSNISIGDQGKIEMRATGKDNE